MHTVVQHPLLQHRLAILRATKTDPKLFRELVHEMTRLIAFEALRDLPTVPVSVRTPMGDAAGVKIEGHMVVAPILRAGMGMLDPMLATGGSACDAIATLKKNGFRRIVFLNIIACPEGIARVEREHPDVPIFTAAIDDHLNDRHYIVPGLGDAGDRLFGTL